MAAAAAAALAALFAGCGDVPTATPASSTVPGSTVPGSTVPGSTVPDTSAPTPDGPAAGAPGDVPRVDGPAAADDPAGRVGPPLSTCQRIATTVAAGHPATTQQVIVRTDSWTDSTATLEVARLTDAGWICGDAMTARLGRSGTRPLLERRSGDGTTPAGIFPLATMTAPDGQRFSFFGNAADPGVSAGTYRRVRTGDCFGATPNTPGYGHLRYDTSCPGPDDEYLPRYVTTYSNAALIGANMEPDVSGDAPGEIPYAAAIFLHRHTYVSGGSGATKPTAGCVSLAQGDLTAVLRGMTADVRFVIGPTSWLLAGG